MLDFLLTDIPISSNKYYQIYSPELLDQLSSFDFAILSVGPEKEKNGFNSIRIEYQKLKKNSIKILDFGYIITHQNIQEQTLNNIEKIINICHKENISLIILSTYTQTNYPIFNCLYQNKSKISPIFIEPSIKISKDEQNITLSNYLEFFSKNTDIQSKIQILGIQNYLSNPENTTNLKKLDITTYRLSQIREDILYYEPVFRESNIAGISISSIKYSDAPAAAQAQPNGFDALEICKLAYFIGINEKLKIINIYDFIAEYDQRNINAKLIAQIIWHILNAREWIKNSKKLNSKLNSYIISTSQEELKNIQLEYIHDRTLDLWSAKIKYKDKEIKIPCSHKDFIKSKKGIITKRILRSIKTIKTNNL
jgi:formiminoglutamase